MAVKNVVFEVSADTSKAQQELSKLLEQLNKIKESSKIGISSTATGLDAQIQALSQKLDAIAAKNIARSNNETKTVTANKTKQVQSDIQVIAAEEKANEKRIAETNKFWEELGKVQTQNQESLNKDFNTRIQEQVKSVQKAETQKSKDIKAAFDERDKAQQTSNKETEKATNAEIKSFEQSQKEINDAREQGRKDARKDIAQKQKEQEQTNQKQLKQEKDLANELRNFTQQEQKDVDKLRDGERKKAEKNAQLAEKTKKTEEFKASPYGQLIQQAQVASEKVKQLGAQLFLLEQTGKKNTAEYNALSKEFKKASQEATKLNQATGALKISSTLGGSKQALTGIAGAVNFISQSAANSSTNFVRLRNIIARTGVALGAVSIGASILSFGRAAIKAATDYEVLSVSFGTLIGNATLAQQKIKELRVFAAETPFTVDDVFQASRTLLGYGVTVGELIPTIKTLGDVAGGVGVPLERIALVFGQVRAAGRLYGQDLLQLVTAGFNPLSEISRTTGESFDSLKDKMRKGLITFDDVQNAFITATSEGGKFFGLTNALANTTTGQLARLNEEWTELLRQVGEGLLPTFNSLVNFGRALLEFFKDLPKTIKDNAIVFTLLTTATTALTAAYFANSLNVVKNTGVTVFNTAAKVANRVATALQAGATVIATRGVSGLTIAQAGLTTATRLGTSAVNAFKAAWVTNPLGLIATVLATAAAGFYAFSDAVDTSTDNFIDADEAFAEFEVTAKKATDEQIAAVEKTFAVIKDTTKSLNERQKAADKVNKEYETGLKLVGDEKKDVNAINTAWLNVKDAIKAANDEIVSGEIIKKLKSQIADVQIELLNLSRKEGVQIPLTLLTSDKEIKSGYEETQAIIDGQIDSLEGKQRNIFGIIAEGASLGGVPGAIIATGNAVKYLGDEKNINGVEKLNVQLGKLRDSQKTLGAFVELLKGDGLGGTGTGGGDDAAAAEKERLRRLKEYQDQLASLLDRIRKNNEDIRKSAIEFQFVDAADFEEEVAKLQLLDKINEERVNREIDKEIEAVRRRDLTEQQKNVLIAQLEIIRGQEQQQRAFDLQDRIYEIERDGTLARRKLALELNDLYNDIASDRLKKELDSLNELRDGFEDFYNDIFEDNPFAKGRFIKAPLFGDFGFQFEDVEADIEGLKRGLQQITQFSPGDLFDDTAQGARLELIDEFNKKYGTTIKLTEDELGLQQELSKAYSDIQKKQEALAASQKKVGIFRFAKQVIEQGANDPFKLGLEDSRREYFTKLDEDFKTTEKGLIDARNAAATEFRTLYEGNLIEKADADAQLLILDTKLQEDIKKAEEETDQAKKDRLKEDIKANEDRVQQLKDIIQEERDARLQALEDIKDAFLDFQKVFIDGQIQQTEAAISAQEKRVQAAQEIADRGNVVLLKAEQERLDKLNRQRASFVRQQQNLAAVEIAVNSAVAVAKAAGQPGSPFTIFAILAAMAVGFAQARAQAQSAATFAKGGYTGDGHQFQEAGTVHKGEFVMNAQKTRQYRPLLEAIHAGRNPKALQSVQDRMLIVNSQSTDERLERIERAIIGQKGMQLSIDENGINGIVSRITYKQQRINNRAR
jgi:hypothetical protein